MVFVVNDNSPMVAIAVEVATLKFFNWTTKSFDSTAYSPSAHNQAMTPLIASPAALAIAQDVDVSALVGKAGILIYACSVDSAGNPVQVVDFGTPPSAHSAAQGIFV